MIEKKNYPVTIFDFLPISLEDMHGRGWYYYDFLLITGDAYIDHPSFGAAVIGRVLEDAGFRVAILSQPGYKDTSDIIAVSRPRYAALITAGNLDSMVAHYTASKKPRRDDYYTPGKKSGKRPDRAVTVYSKLVKEAFPDLPVIIGGLEASLRRFAHYDYWDDKIRRSVLHDSTADLLVFGPGETAIVEIAGRLASKEKIDTIKNVRGTGYLTTDINDCTYPHIICASYEEVCKNKKSYAEATMIQHNEHDPVRGKAVIQEFETNHLIINPPAKPLTGREIDHVYSLPYSREVHPMYNEYGGIAAIEEVRFSVIHNRGCFGDCNYCALAFHQGRVVSSRSHESVINEVRGFIDHPEFKGYVHDVGGPTANFRKPSCTRQKTKGMCPGKNCLVPLCDKLETDHTDYLLLLKKLASLPGIKKVFIRSGIRFDYMLADKNGEFFTELVKNHISGQLKIAPEHCSDNVLYYMGKPDNSVYEKFVEKYKRLNLRYGKNQYLVPYLMSSHPGNTLADSVELAVYLNKQGRHPQQVQIFYPTPGTLSTCMYYTGIDPRTMKRVSVPRSQKEKNMQRALLQWKRPENYETVKKALKEAGREDLTGYSKHCLIKPKRKGIKNSEKTKKFGKKLCN